MDKPSYNLDELKSQDKLIMTQTAWDIYNDHMDRFNCKNLKELSKALVSAFKTGEFKIEYDYLWEDIYAGILLEGMFKEKIIKIDRLVTTKYVQNGLTRYVFV